jgi:hypothetical protein
MQSAGGHFPCILERQGRREGPGRRFFVHSHQCHGAGVRNLLFRDELGNLKGEITILK